MAVPPALVALAVWLWLKPPALLRVGAGYAAKIVCSNLFIAGRDPEEVLAADVQAPGISVLKYLRVSVDKDQRVVRAGFLGFIGGGLAVATPHHGCTVLPDGKFDSAALLSRLQAAAGPPTASASAPAPSAGVMLAPTPSAGGTLAPSADGTADSTPWPEGTAVTTNPALDQILARDQLAGPGIRALIVVDHGRIVAERYLPGFSAGTPLLGWSMTKSVTAGLIGMAVKDGRLSLEQSAFWPAAANDGRDHIRLADLLAMSSGLRFNEQYGAVSDVTRMLYLEPDMAGFARSQPLDRPPGTYWSYSSGTAVILARILQDAVAADAESFAERRLFQPLGMASAVIEPDEHGTLVGSSYMYATARDWARYAQFLLQGGVWQGQALLPAGYVKMMAAPVAASGGQYGRGQVWLWGSDADTPGTNPDAAFGIPADTFWLEGHDGQFIAIMPSRQLVVVRMGLTPAKLHYRPQPLIQAVLDATRS